MGDCETGWQVEKQGNDYHGNGTHNDKDYDQSQGTTEYKATYDFIGTWIPATNPSMPGHFNISNHVKLEIICVKPSGKPYCMAVRRHFSKKCQLFNFFAISVTYLP